MKVKRGEAGFTLVELLVVVLITSIIGAAIVGVVASVSRAETVALDVSNNLDSARQAVERVRDVIRGSYAICDDSTSQQLRLWRQDSDGDRRVDADEITVISVVGGALTRTDGSGPPRQLAFGIGTSSFDYTDVDGDPVAPPLTGRGIDCASTGEHFDRGDVTTVNLTLSGDRAPGGRTPATVVESQITLRNAIIADGSIQPNRTPSASFKHTCSPPSCSFDASDSHDEDGEIVSYAWEFGDGTVGSGETTNHVFATYGTYAVTLTVVDDAGASASVTQFISVNLGNANPAAQFTHTCTALACSFNGSASFDVDGTIEAYQWDFGDGASSSSGPTTTHTYASAGSYAVSLTVVDDEGATGTQTRIVNPTIAGGGVTTRLVDASTLGKNSSHYFARARITVTRGGAPVVGVNVRGRFGGDTSPLVAQQTNAEGVATLQANGEYHKNTTIPFTIVEVEGQTLEAGSETTIVLRHPG
jgi:prepilin-type N-terminal cleavage/methylation domain-containing protein